MSDEAVEGWWAGYFDERFMRLYRPLLPAAETAAEVEAVAEVMGLGAGSRLLDLACGWGRHAAPLAARGVEVVGIDRSEPLLRAAAGGGARGARWIRGDVRALPLRGPFDAVVSLFSSLGYFLDDESDLQALREVRRVLSDGGLFLLETMHRDLLARDFAERDWWETGEGTVVRVERAFDAVRGVSHETLHWRDADGGSGRKEHAIRVRSATEWGALLQAAGLLPIGWYGSWEMEPFTRDSERLIVLATPD